MQEDVRLGEPPKLNRPVFSSMLLLLGKLGNPITSEKCFKVSLYQSNRYLKPTHSE